MQCCLQFIALATQTDTTGGLVSPARNQLELLDGEFTSSVQTLIDTLNFYATTESASFGNLVTRIDYNGFYAKRSMGSG